MYNSIIERDHGYQYGTTAHKKSDNDIDVPYFVTPEFQRARREQELRRQQIEKAQREKELAELELQKRARHQKTGRRVNNIVQQHNQEYSRAHEKKIPKQTSQIRHRDSRCYVNFISSFFRRHRQYRCE